MELPWASVSCRCARAWTAVCVSASKPSLREGGCWGGGGKGLSDWRRRMEVEGRPVCVCVCAELHRVFASSLFSFCELS